MAWFVRRWLGGRSIAANEPPDLRISFFPVDFLSPSADPYLTTATLIRIRPSPINGIASISRPFFFIDFFTRFSFPEIDNVTAGRIAESRTPTDDRWQVSRRKFKLNSHFFSCLERCVFHHQIFLGEYLFVSFPFPTGTCWVALGCNSVSRRFLAALFTVCRP